MRIERTSLSCEDNAISSTRQEYYTTLTPDQAVAKLVKMRKELIRNLRAAEAQSLRDGKRIARKWSSGGVKSIRLAQMGGPYGIYIPRLHAKPRGAPPSPLELINRQSGLFRSSWRTKLGNFSGDKIDSTIVNTAPYAGYLERGTYRMVPRHVLAKVLEELEPIRKKNMFDAVKKTLSS